MAACPVVTAFGHPDRLKHREADVLRFLSDTVIPPTST